MCGKSVPKGGGAKTWQWFQQVSEKGTYFLPQGHTPRKRTYCTATDTGVGKLNSDQDNLNDQGNSPP